MEAIDPGVSLLVYLAKIMIQKSLESARRDWVTTEGSGRRVEVVMTFKPPPLMIPDWVLVAIEGPDRLRTAVHAELSGRLSLRVVAGPQNVAAMFLKQSMFNQVPPTIVGYHQSRQIWVKPRQEFSVVGQPVTAEVVRVLEQVPPGEREYRIAGERSTDPATGRPVGTDLGRVDDHFLDALTNGWCRAHVLLGVCGKRSPNKNRLCEQHYRRVLAGETVYWDHDGDKGKQIHSFEIR